MRRLLVLLLIFALLAPALPVVKAESTYYALSFDGEDDYVDIGTEPCNLTQFTIITIFELTEKDKVQDIIKRSPDLASGEVRIRVNYKNKLVAYISDGSETYGFSTLTFEFNKKHFVAFRYNSTNLDLFYDDVNNPYSTMAPTITIASDTYHWLIGRYSSASQYFMTGKIYLVLIYNRALSDSEIQAIYNDPLNPPQDGLVLFYAPDSVDTANGLWKDKSGHGNDGTIYGASYVPLRPLEESTPSQSSPYGLYFDGEDDYVEAGAGESTKLKKAVSVIAIINANPDLFSSNNGWIVGRGKDTTSGYHLYSRLKTYLTFKVFVNQSGSTAIAFMQQNFTNYFNNNVFVAGTYDVSSGGALYINDVKVAEDTTTGDEIIYPHDTTLDIGHLSYGNLYPFGGKIYYLLIYARKLSDSEIQQIYENPTNPPKDGLVLWYSPYTYDPSAGKWLNRAPIFPTIPLAEEIDGQNYGATAERVSIPDTHYYDIENNSEIDVSTVSVEMLSENSTISLIPSFLVLPYNTTVALNVSATNYLSSLVYVTTPIDSLKMYLSPSESLTISPEEIENATAPAEEFQAPEIARGVLSIFTKWLGGEYLIHLFDMDLDAMLADYFSNPPLPGLNVLTALMLFVGASLATYAYFKEPEHTWIAGNLVYFGLIDYLPGFTPAIVFGPLALFNLYLGYQAFMKYAKKLGGR